MAEDKPNWERAGAKLWRIAVPGGWLYSKDLSDRLTFVPGEPVRTYVPVPVDTGTVSPFIGLPYTVT